MKKKYHKIDRELRFNDCDGNNKRIAVIDNQEGVVIAIEDLDTKQQSYAYMRVAECRQLIAMLNYRLRFVERDQHTEESEE